MTKEEHIQYVLERLPESLGRQELLDRIEQYGHAYLTIDGTEVGPYDAVICFACEDVKALKRDGKTKGG